MRLKLFCCFVTLFISSLLAAEKVQLGLDRVFSEPFSKELKGKKVGLITNSAAIDSDKVQSFNLFLMMQNQLGYELKAAFAPEHGFEAKVAAFEKIYDEHCKDIQIHSLHGDTKRPTDEMLEGIDLLIFDMQSVGVRCYTYETTLSYVMEKAAELKIPFWVLDRPNPRSDVVEGKDVQEKYRCFFSYNKVPFCHGMTIGELARYLNSEEKVGCCLTVIAMKGWKRCMSFEETGLPWSAPSPNIPDSMTSLVYPATVLIGESLEIVSADINGEKPFKRIGAPWIEERVLANALNERNLPGVIFIHEVFTPKFGKYQEQICRGVYLKVTDHRIFKPLQTQYAIFEELKALYPKEFEEALKKAIGKRRDKTIDYITGNQKLMHMIQHHDTLLGEMQEFEEHYIRNFLIKREPHLLYSQN